MRSQTVLRSVDEIHRPERDETQGTAPGVFPVSEIGIKRAVFRVAGDIIVHCVAALLMLWPGSLLTRTTTYTRMKTRTNIILKLRVSDLQ